MSSPRAPLIMLIRHAEKPDKPPPHGVTKHGDHDAESLTVEGWQRAGALACFFAPTHGALQSPLLATPEVLYAAAPGKRSGSEGSQSERPLQTITPLAKKLGRTIRTDFTKGEETKLADAAMAEIGTVLVCWQHQDIHLIANRILGNDTTAPQKWPGSRFDLVWVFDLQADGGYTFVQVPQMLLKGDVPDPISG